MKIPILIFLFITNFFIIKCDSEDSNNINIETISYELTYNNYSVVKVVIKTNEEIEADISFIAYLKSEGENKEYRLNCSNTFYDVIECLSPRNISFNINDKYYFYYNQTNSKITFNENDIFEDEKRVSLIFKPEITIHDKLYRDNKKIVADIGKRMVGGGVLYITKKSKQVLQKPKDGFNKFIELNNFISHSGLYGQRPESTLIAFKEAIRRGFYIVDADIQFTSDKIPVISHETDLEKVSDGSGKLESKTLAELEKLDFGSKFDKKYAGEKILTFENLLCLCKENNVIIDLDLAHLDYQKYFEQTNEYATIILNLTEKYNMIDSIFFNDGGNPNTILKLKQINNNISVSISNMNKKENIEKVKDQYTGSKRIIYNMGGLSRGNTIDEETVKYAKSLGKNVKAAVVNDCAMADKIQKWGVNYITTDKLEPFLLCNEKEDPIIVRCTPLDDDTSDCDIEDSVVLKDNEYYNIYYTDNIYNLSENINTEPIAEFQYIDTNLLDELYYAVRKFDFEAGIVQLNLSHELEKNERIYGIVGPAYENAAECYQYNFICTGNGSYFADCKIQKEDEEKVQFKGNYCVYSVEDYSLNEFQIEEKKHEEQEGYIEYFVEKKTSYFYVFVIIMVIIIVSLIIYLIKCREGTYYNAIRDTDNNYMPDDYYFR